MCVHVWLYCYPLAPAAAGVVETADLEAGVVEVYCSNAVTYGGAVVIGLSLGLGDWRLPYAEDSFILVLERSAPTPLGHR
jgi:hypothetical protein